MGFADAKQFCPFSPPNPMRYAWKPRLAARFVLLLTKPLNWIVRLLWRAAARFLRYFAGKMVLAYQCHDPRTRKNTLDVSQVVFDASVVGLLIVFGIAHAVV